MQEFKDLLKAGVHFGHKTSKWSPKMAPYIWGSKNKVHLIDISKTSLLLKRTTTFLKEISSEGKQILWVGTKKAAGKIIQKVGQDLDMPVVTNRWIGGTLSNNNQIKKAITKLLHLRDVIKKSTSYYTKKELSTLQKEIARLEKNVGGITNFAYPPAAIVVVDAKRERAAVSEALCSGVPVIAMVDTNTDPTGINFVIPANDDSPKSIKCIMDQLAAAVAEGKKVYEKTHKKEEPKKKPVEAKVPKAEAKKEAPKAEAKKETLKKEAPKVGKPVKEEKKEAAPKPATKKAPAKPAAKKAAATKKATTTKKPAAKTTKKATTTAKKTVAKKPATKKTTTKAATKKTTAKK